LDRVVAAAGENDQGERQAPSSAASMRVHEGFLSIRFTYSAARVTASRYAVGSVKPCEANPIRAAASRTSAAESAGAAVKSITAFSGSVTYQIGSREGTAVAHLQIAAPGRFLVRATSSGAPPGSHLAIGSNISGGIAAIVFPALVLGLAAVGGAIVVAVVRHTRIKRARLPQLLG